MEQFTSGMQPWPEYIEFFISLIAMLNPIGAVPMFLMFTQTETLDQRKDTARIASLTVCGVLLAAVFVGDMILNTFGVTIPAFRVGGGLLILLTALANLQAQPGAMKQTAEEADEGLHKAQVAVVINVLKVAQVVRRVVLIHVHKPVAEIFAQVLWRKCQTRLCRLQILMRASVILINVLKNSVEPQLLQLPQLADYQLKKKKPLNYYKALMPLNSENVKWFFSRKRKAVP